MAPIAGGDVEALVALPYWWILWLYLHLLTEERRDQARRAAELETLVYGLALAFHNPSGLREWRQEVRDGAGLLQSPQTAKQQARHMIEKLKGLEGEWRPLEEQIPR